MPEPSPKLPIGLIRRWRETLSPALFDEVLEQIEQAYVAGVDHGRLPLVIAERMESELPQGVFDEIVGWLKKDKLIHAIKAHRAATQVPLKESKEVVMRLRDNLGLTRNR